MKWIIVLLLLASCGPVAKLRKAQKLIDKAIADGATVKSDTTWNNIKFTTPAISFNTTLENPNWNDTLFVRAPGKDSIVVKIKKIPATPTEPEKVYVAADCPEREQEVPCPEVVNQTIKAGYSLWDLIILAIVCLLAGTFLGGPIVRTLRDRT